MEQLNPERELIALCIEDSALVPEVRARVSPGAFKDKRNRKVYSIILELSERGEPIDRLIVSDNLMNTSAFEDLFKNDSQALESWVLGYQANESGNYVKYSEMVNDRHQRSSAKQEFEKASKRIKDGQSVVEVVEDLNGSIEKIERIVAKPFEAFSNVIGLVI